MVQAQYFHGLFYLILKITLRDTQNVLFLFQSMGTSSEEVSKLPRAAQLIRCRTSTRIQCSVIHPKEGWVWRSDELK